MRRILLLFAITAVLFTGHSYADAVSDWNATAVTVTLRIPNPARSVLVDLSYLHIAIFDAVNAIDKRYTAFSVSPPNAVPWASQEAAVHGAAHKILRTFYLADSLYIDSVFNARISLLPNDSTTTKGIEIGHTAAELFLQSRNGDGREANTQYIWQPAGPGVYQPTPRGSAQYQPAVPWQANLRPFSFTEPSKFRAPGPPSLNSSRYAADLNEVRVYGSLDTTFTTPEQREMARFHTENPGIQTPRNIRNFVESQGLPLSDNARLFAQLFAAIGDALITGWESKYYYNFWRPSTAIQNAEIDGNPHTIQDTSWRPLVTTPRHPEYPAAHGVVLGAIANTIKIFFGTENIPVTMTSTVTGVPHHFSNVNEIITESINARVYGGMHFRSSVEDGTEIGRKVAEWVAENKFQLYVPVNELISVLPVNAGIQNALASKLQNAVEDYADGKYNAAKNLLNALLNQLNQLIANGSVTQAEAQPLVDYVNNYLELIAAMLPKIASDEIPGDYALYQNYPNPFNPVTTIEFRIPNNSYINLKIYDILGNEVITLLNEEKSAGKYQISFDAKNLSSGIYYYILRAGSFIQTKKMILMK